MKMLIGITQDPQASAAAVCRQGTDLVQSAEVGPFASQEAAGQWLEFILRRGRGYEQLPVACPDNGADASPWYGCTFTAIKPGC
ncbi:hypothetical protein [Desulfogranum mediterraneum]|uniref:hypothetical protein n=1 Tax=Desulfogranum mediterraneum TaxID=160661 RepID=UPI00041BF1AC|nr:hypothetical protein [Desulfogranum mediterraneum]